MSVHLVYFGRRVTSVLIIGNHRLGGFSSQWAGLLRDWDIA